MSVAREQDIAESLRLCAGGQRPLVGGSALAYQCEFRGRRRRLSILVNFCDGVLCRNAHVVAAVPDHGTHRLLGGFARTLAISQLIVQIKNGACTDEFHREDCPRRLGFV